MMKPTSKPVGLSPEATETVTSWAKLTGKSESLIASYMIRACRNNTVTDLQKWLEAQTEVEKQRKLAETRIRQAKANVPKI